MATDIETGLEPSTSGPQDAAPTEASVTELCREMHALAHTALLPRLIDVLLPHPAETFTRRWLVGAGALDLALRLLIPVVATTAVGAWADAPLWKWAAIASVLTADHVVTLARHNTRPRVVDDFLALTRTLELEAQVRQLSRQTRRWLRPSVRLGVSAVLALPVVAVGMVVDPRGLTSIHVGSAAMLLAVLYEFSENVLFNLVAITLLLRSESRFPHRLSWLSPADTPAIPRMLHAWGTLAVIGALSVVFYMMPVVLLVAPGTVTFLIALLGAMTLTGYLVTVVSYLSVRASVRSIVRRHQQDTLERLQRKVADFRPRLGELTASESERLQGLMDTYAAVRDAPLTPRGSEAGSHALTALAVPGLGFSLAVLAEVYAERLLTLVVP